MKLTNNEGVSKVVKNQAGAVVLTLAPSDFMTVEPAPLEDNFENAVAAFNAAHSADTKIVGGAAIFTSNSNVSGGAAGPGRKYVELNPANAIRQNCYVNAFRFVALVVNGGNWKFGIGRPAGGGSYTVIGESQAFAPSATGDQVITCTTPIGPCQPGDVPLLFLPGSISSIGAVVRCTDKTGDNIAYVVGDPSPVTPTTNVANVYLDIRALSPPPFYIPCGDSIEAGHNELAFYPFLDGGISGNIEGEIAHHLRDLCPGLTYQNWSRGNTAWDHAVTHIGAMVAIGPRLIEFGFGINDIGQGRDWTTWIKPKAETCIAACQTAGIIPVLREVLPCTAGNDANAVAIRGLNANYASLCATTGALLLPCHDAMAEIRPSTGLLDNLKAAFNYDGTHLKEAGVAEMATIKNTFYTAQDWT